LEATDDGRYLRICEDTPGVEVTYGIAQIVGTQNPMGRARWIRSKVCGHVLAVTFCDSATSSQNNLGPRCRVSFIDVAGLRQRLQVPGALVARSADGAKAVVLRNDSLIFIPVGSGSKTRRLHPRDTAEVELFAEAWGRRVRPLGTWSFVVKVGDRFGPPGIKGTGIDENSFRVLEIDDRRIIVESENVLAPGIPVSPLNVYFKRRFLVSDASMNVGTISRDAGISIRLRRLPDPRGR
jgi:hypothetical protein